jgi:hypothetical protein
VAVVIALGLYPQFVVHRTERDTGKAISKAVIVQKGKEVSVIK